MGQASISGIIPASKEVKWRSGTKTDAVPAPSANGVSSFDRLVKSSAFKDFLCQNIDSSHLISSILSAAIQDEKSLLEGVAIFQGLDSEFRQNILTQVDSFDSVVKAGINVSIE